MACLYIRYERIIVTGLRGGEEGGGLGSGGGGGGLGGGGGGGGLGSGGGGGGLINIANHSLQMDYNGPRASPDKCCRANHFTAGKPKPSLAERLCWQRLRSALEATILYTVSTIPPWQGSLK